VRRGHALHGPVEVIESLLGNDGGDLGRHAAVRRALVDDDERAGLLHRCDDRADVER